MEIKFRAWYDNKELLDVDTIFFDGDNPFVYLRKGESRFGQGGCPVVLEQFTGEKCYVTHSDLYVGDIMERNLELFVIEFKHGSFVCRSVDKPHKSYSLSIFTSVTSVGNAGAKIGNIHNNAELLEAESGSCY